MGALAFVDGRQNVPGCRCEDSCEFPCWQRVGIAPPCESCPCNWGEDYEG